MILVVWHVRLFWISVSNGSGILDCEGMLGERFSLFQRYYNAAKCHSMIQHHIAEDLNCHCIQVMVRDFQEPS